MSKSSPKSKRAEVTSESGTSGGTNTGVEETPRGSANRPLETSASEDPSKARIFLSFNYPELKDLGKHFLTLSSATAVFLLTFVEKLIGSNASFNHLIKACMASLLLSIAAAGTGLFFNYIAGAGASGAIIWGIGKNRFRELTIATYVLYMLAGSALFFAYALLAYATLYR
jgi:hypothetical protein